MGGALLMPHLLKARTSEVPRQPLSRREVERIRRTYYQWSVGGPPPARPQPKKPKKTVTAKKKAKPKKTKKKPVQKAPGGFFELLMVDDD
jgi:hypothetical protein